MPARPRRGALGLRGRIVGAVLVTTVATLAVAALALLGPLEQKLRTAEETTLRNGLNGGALISFEKLVLLPPISTPTATELLGREAQLGTRLGATVTVLGFPGEGELAHGLPLAPAQQDADTVAADPFDDVAIAFRTGKPKYTFGTINGTEYARAALPFRQPLPTVAGPP